MSDEIIVRSSTLTDVDAKLRLVDLIAVPWDEEADVLWRSEVWRERFDRNAFNGIEAHAGRVMVNREHRKGDTVGKVVRFDTSSDDGLIARVKVAKTARGDETLALAEEDMISASVGYFVKRPSDVQLNKRAMTRRVMRAFLDHLGMVESPAFAGAQVLAVREAPSELAAAVEPLPSTPLLDEMQANPLLEWAAQRLGK